jgi:hypothetical protein
MRETALALFLSMSVLTAATAQVTPQRAPFPVEGWRYTVPSAGLHMHECLQTRCQPGARVSYRVRVAAPDRTMTLETFKDMRRRIETELRQRLPAGSLLQAEEPTGGDTGPVRILRSRRVETRADGASVTTLAILFIGRTMTVDLVSSSADPSVVDANAQTFLALIVSSDALGLPPRSQ